MRIALVALHFAEYASRLAVALSARHDVLLVLRSSNAQSELTDELRAQLSGKVRLITFEPRRRRDPRHSPFPPRSTRSTSTFTPRCWR